MYCGITMCVPMSTSTVHPRKPSSNPFSVTMVIPETCLDVLRTQPITFNSFLKCNSRMFSFVRVFKFAVICAGRRLPMVSSVLYVGMGFSCVIFQSLLRT